MKFRSKQAFRKPPSTKIDGFFAKFQRVRGWRGGGRGLICLSKIYIKIFPFLLRLYLILKRCQNAHTSMYPQKYFSLSQNRAGLRGFKGYLKLLKKIIRLGLAGLPFDRSSTLTTYYANCIS